jgi:hypothetical protein
VLLVCNRRVDLVCFCFVQRGESVGYLFIYLVLAKKFLLVFVMVKNGSSFHFYRIGLCEGIFIYYSCVYFYFYNGRFSV